MKINEVIAALEALEESSTRTPPPEPWELRLAPLIEDWIMIIVPRDKRPSLSGVVTGHPLIEDGKAVATSELVGINESAGWAKTKSRYYRLGSSAGEGADDGHS